ncbi:MAG: DUF2269 domain-containing protein [Gammaproteobacteria bacterium]|nr:DUF2269 domain-containing protein [Gammaproteobacteria bacterium]
MTEGLFFNQHLRWSIFNPTVTFLFVILQPLTGYWLINMLGYSLTEPWLVASYVLFIIAGACWLPVVWMQIRMRNLSQQALQDGVPLVERYHRFARRWFRLGMPAFTSMALIYYLMVFNLLLQRNSMCTVMTSSNQLFPICTRFTP